MTSAAPPERSRRFTFSSLFIATPFKVVDGCVKNTLPNTHTHLPNPPSVKVNKGSQLRTNEQGPLRRDACLRCLPPRTPARSSQLSGKGQARRR